MERSIVEHGITLGVELILSIAISIAFKRGLVFLRREIYEWEREKLSQEIYELELEKLKLKTESKLEMLWKHYCDTNGNMQRPEGLPVTDIVEDAFLIDESLKEQILGLTKIYLDLCSNGTDSSYFVLILDAYGHIVGM